MPSLKKIVIQDFRNITLQEIEFSPNLNCITGGNGEGKTNLLDAIYYLSMTKSAFSPSDRFCFRHGCSSFALSGLYNMPGDISTRISVQVDEGGDKKIRRDDKAYGKVSEHIGAIPVVMVSPADSALVSESGEERRRFVNAVLSQIDRSYLSGMQQYNRLLAQRNKLLKDGNVDAMLLDTIDYRLAQVAGPLHSRRAAFADELLPVVKDFYSRISGGREEVGISYRSDLNGHEFMDVMAACRERDMVMKYTTAGIQRDDFVFTMDSHSIRRCGSQGQQKSFLVALKFAQYDIMKGYAGVPPVLLLDDLFDKLDMDRIANLLKMVAGSDFGQIFISDANKVRTETLVAGITEDSAFFEAEAGCFHKVERNG